MTEPIKAESGKRKKTPKSLRAQYKKKDFKFLMNYFKTTRETSNDLNVMIGSDVYKKTNLHYLVEMKEFKGGLIDNNENLNDMLNHTFSIARLDQIVNSLFRGCQYLSAQVLIPTTNGKKSDRCSHTTYIFRQIPRLPNIGLVELNLPWTDQHYTIPQPINDDFNYRIGSEGFSWDRYYMEILFSKDGKNTDHGLLVPFSTLDSRRPYFMVDFFEDSQTPPMRELARKARGLNSYILTVKYNRKKQESTYRFYDGYFSQEALEKGLIKAINSMPK